MFSVIIPLYNKSAYIEKCLQSIHNQTFQDFEVIIVNDGSTDDSDEKVERFRVQSSKFKVITQVNAGVSTARNNGAEAAKHNYLVFLDADDWWDIHFLEEMERLIEYYPEAGIWGTNYYYVKNGINKIENKGLEPGFQSGYIDYFKIYSSTFCVPFNCSFVAVDKNVFLDNKGFNPVLKFGEDLDLWIRISLSHKVAYLNKPLAYSNQDVEISNRALGSIKLFAPEENVIFNLSYLKNEEASNPSLKKLLDGLRVRSLSKYYLSDLYPELTGIELGNVDFSSRIVTTGSSIYGRKLW